MPTAPEQESRRILPPDLVWDLARRFGTPLYVVDEARVRERIRAFRLALERAWSRSRLVYAAKANPARAILQIAHAEGCGIDVASEGELRAALAAGIPASACILHGNNKSRSELELAFSVRVGHIVVDNFTELNLIFEIARARRERETDVEASEMPASLGSHRSPALLIRVTPGIDPHTHAKISTGQEDTKFGFSIPGGVAERAVVTCLGLGLPLEGFHLHVGSQVTDPGVHRAAAEIMGAFASDIQRRHRYQARVLNLGGGFPARYLDSEETPPIEQTCRSMIEGLLSALGEAGGHPIVMLEPGRALVAEAGVTLYTVGAVKSVLLPDGRERLFVAVDGGYGDNPRPALYGARYEVIAVPQDPLSWPGEPVLRPVTVVGRHCENDTLFADVMLPVGLREGDLLQVLTTGAYHASMANNYNLFPRPATVLIRPDGRAKIIQRRETHEELLARESGLEESE